MHPVYTFRKPPYGPTFPRWFPRMFPYLWERILYRVVSNFLLFGMPVLVISLFLGKFEFIEANGNRTVFDLSWIFTAASSVMLFSLVMFSLLILRVHRRNRSPPCH